jgi:hypothetical protein
MKENKLLLPCYYLGLLVFTKHFIWLLIDAHNGEIVDGWGVTVVGLWLFFGLIFKYTRSFKQLIICLLIAVIFYIGAAAGLTLLMP